MNILEIVAIITAVLGGGGLWTWLLSRRKSQAEAVSIANDAAIKNMAVVMDTLKTRVMELGNENAILREQLELQSATIEERHEAELEKLAEQKEYFQAELGKTQATLRRLEEDFHSCKADLMEKAEALGRAQAKLDDYLLRFPQFTERRTADRRGTGALNPDMVTP